MSFTWKFSSTERFGIYTSENLDSFTIDEMQPSQLCDYQEI